MTDPPTTPGKWLICVDTGGTFTDCVAWSPGGDVRRAKVLSTGRLRVAVRPAAGDGLTVAGLRDVPLAAFAGFTARTPGGDQARVTAAAPHPSDPDLTTLALDRPLPLASIVELTTGEPAPVLAARLVTATPPGTPFPPLELRLATTRGTNALLERRAGPAALFITRGFADLLAIGTQQRPDLFALDARKPRPIDCDTIEVRARLDAHGHEIHPLDADQLRRDARALVARGITTAAVCLMHSWRNAEHERRAAAILTAEGFRHISLSSEVAPAIGFLARTQTTLANAYLAPVVDRFVADVLAAVQPAVLGQKPATAEKPGTRLFLMTSAAGLVPAGEFRPKDSLLSGPAGGVIGALAAARASGLTNVLTFDMGGTSTDVARIDHDLEYVYEHRVGDAQVLAPAVAVESVAAGGGSVCWFDRATASLKVGPHSAGASPGPACYGMRGPLTITDVNLLLNRVDPARFRVPLSEGAARDAANQLLSVVRTAGRDLTLEDLLRALLSIANEQMAAAIRTVSVRRGYDPSDYTLLAFGGAGGQHACAVADLLGIETILIPPDVGLLSARGLAAAPIERFAASQVLKPLHEANLAGTLGALAAAALDQLRAQGFRDATVARRLFSLRLQGQEAALTVDLPSRPATGIEPHLESEFARLFRQHYGYDPVSRALEVESVRVVARASPPSARPLGATPASFPRATSAQVPGPAPRHGPLDRASITLDRPVQGPALITEANATTVLEPGWSATADHTGALSLRRTTPPAATQPPAARRELLTARLTAIAADMGETLRRTALSTNVKDRLDFSCALLNAGGELIVNAPHIPVHLGALGICTRAVAAALDLKPGDVAVTNHPRYGGSHLPDVTVITPVFEGGTLIGYAASRAHHAEIGGIRPGSMAPGARTLDEEGVVIPPMRLVAAGVLKLDGFRRVLLTAKHPTRALEENLADVQAQLAANATGAAGLLQVFREHGPELSRIIGELFDHAESRVRAWLESRGEFQSSVRELLDDGTPIDVHVRRLGPATVLKLESPGPHPGNLNAPFSVTRSAVMYVLRCLVNEPLPLVERLLRPLTLSIGPGMLDPHFDDHPARCPAIAAGNVETSQRVVDALLRAFDAAACSQGTMNNVIFGNDRFGYYETVCGGAGATPTSHGESAVHTHMTNTRITDPELLEHRYPVRLDRFAVRKGSGGAGQYHGGDGVVREYTFLEPVSLSLLTQHRSSGPYGLHAGQPGRPGEQHLHWPDGRADTLPPSCSLDIPAGARLVLQTPGGGGFGPPVR